MDDGPAAEGSVDAAGAAALASPEEGSTAAKENPNVGGGPCAAARWSASDVGKVGHFRRFSV